MAEETKNEGWISKLNWKHGLLLTGLVVVVYPRPFISLMKPIINHFKRNYKSANIQPFIEKIIFTTNKNANQKLLLRSRILEEEPQIKIIDKFVQKLNDKNPQYEELVDLLAENVSQQIQLIELQVNFKFTENIVIIVKGEGKLLRTIEAKLLGLKKDEVYKISSFGSEEEVHVLERNKNLMSYEHKIKKYID